jgi:hypothetical protein
MVSAEVFSKVYGMSRVCTNFDNRARTVSLASFTKCARPSSKFVIGIEPALRSRAYAVSESLMMSEMAGLSLIDPLRR